MPDQTLPLWKTLPNLPLQQKIQFAKEVIRSTPITYLAYCKHCRRTINIAAPLTLGDAQVVETATEEKTCPACKEEQTLASEIRIIPEMGQHLVTALNASVAKLGLESKIYSEELYYDEGSNQYCFLSPIEDIIEDVFELDVGDDAKDVKGLQVSFDYDGEEGLVGIWLQAGKKEGYTHVTTWTLLKLIWEQGLWTHITDETTKNWVIAVGMAMSLGSIDYSSRFAYFSEDQEEETPQTGFME